MSGYYMHKMGEKRSRPCIRSIIQDNSNCRIYYMACEDQVMPFQILDFGFVDEWGRSVEGYKGSVLFSCIVVAEAVKA